MEASTEKSNAAYCESAAEASAFVESRMLKMVDSFETEVKGLRDQLEEMKHWRQRAGALEKELKAKGLEIEAVHKKVERKEVEKNLAIEGLERRAKRKAETDKSLLEEAIRGAIRSRPLRNKVVLIFTIFERMGVALDEIESSYSEQIKGDYAIQGIIANIRTKLQSTQSKCSALPKQRWTKAALMSYVFETSTKALRDSQSALKNFVERWVKADGRTTVELIFERMLMALGALQSTYGPPEHGCRGTGGEGGCNAGEEYFDDDDDCCPAYEDPDHAKYCDLSMVGEECVICDRQKVPGKIFTGAVGNP
ncbi:unnamed protein product [Calypogeia fissa]